MTILETIAARRSVRSFDGQDLSPRDQARLSELFADAKNPYDLPVSFALLDARDKGLSSPVITGTSLWLAGKLTRAPHAEEAFGYSFETLLLRTAALGMGTVWIAGTFNRSAFESAMELKPDEIMPCASPVGYPAAKMSLRETLMRRGVKAGERLPFGTLFFDGDFSHPLTPEAAGELITPLEAVRKAPSAVNRQPWRAVRIGNVVHFYEKHSKGYVDKSGWDLQKVDLGIALCHFALAAEALGMTPKLRLEDPALDSPDGIDYIGSFSTVLP